MACKFILALLAMPAFTAGFGSSGSPWSGGFGRFPTHHGFDYDDHDSYYDDYFGYREPCPRYQTMQSSGWQVAADDQLSLKVSVPGVHQRDVDVWLSDDASEIHIKATRALPSQGRRCLPSNAKISRNGRYETLEGIVSVPANGEARGASVKHISGGLLVSMPRRLQQRREFEGPMRTKSNNDHHYRGARAHGQYKRENRFHGARRDAGTSEKSRSPTVTSAEKQTAAPQRHAQAPAQTPVVLPPSTGIVVEDEEYPWPEKCPDAKSGWVDNRGDFQYY